MICGHKAISAHDVVVKCVLPSGHSGSHMGPRAIGETFSWSDRYSKADSFKDKAVPPTHG